MSLSKLWPVVARAIILSALLALRAPLEHDAAAALHSPSLSLAVSRAIDSLTWLTAASLLANLVNALFWRRIIRYALGAPAPDLLQDTSTALIYGAAATAIVTLVFGGSLTAFWTASGAFGLVIGLALRSIILDLFTGIAFSVELSFRIGDWIELRDPDTGAIYYGRVIGLSWRTTRVELEDHRIVVVPNSRMGQLMVVNSTLGGGVVRAEVDVPLDAGIPRSRAVRILEGAMMALAHSRVILADPAPRVLVGAITTSGVDYRLRYWKDVTTTSPSMTRSAVLAGVLDHLASADISPAMGRQEIHLLGRAGRAAGQTDDPRLKFLGRVDLFGQSLTQPELKSLAQSLVSSTLAAGEVLLQEGEQGSSLFVLCEGALEVTTGAGAEEVRLAVIHPGHVVGEMSLLTGAPRSANVRALTEALLYEVRAEALAPLLASRPAIAEALSKVAARRTSATAAAMAQDHGHTNEQVSLLKRIQRFFARAPTEA
jgi:small-conductance mechanosensitive channel